jgi:hypothetical protein
LPTLETVKTFATEPPGAITPQSIPLEETAKFSVEATAPEPAKTASPEKMLEALYDKQTSKPQISNAATIGEYLFCIHFHLKEKKGNFKKRKREGFLILAWSC